MSEEYAEKMPRKNLSELLLYVRNRTEYREDAVLAALDELDRRGQPQPEAASLRAELGPIVQKQQQEKQTRESGTRTIVASPTGAASQPEVAEADGPVLYSPGTIVLFSMLFSFLAGGVLLVINMMRLKESSKAWRIALFSGVLLVLCWLALPWLTATIGPQAQYVGVVVNILAVLSYLLYFWPRYVGERPYVSRQWLPAFLVCLVLAGLYAAALYYQLRH